MKLPFISRNPFAISTLQAKVMYKIQREVEMNIFFGHFQTSSLNFVHNFCLESQNCKRIFENEK